MAFINSLQGQKAAEAGMGRLGLGGLRSGNGQPKKTTGEKGRIADEWRRFFQPGTVIR